MQFPLTPDLFCSTFYNMQLIMGLNALMTINPQLPREIFTPPAPLNRIIFNWGGIRNIFHRGILMTACQVKFLSCEIRRPFHRDMSMTEKRI